MPTAVTPSGGRSRHDHDVAALFERRASRDERPAFLGRFDDHNGRRETRDDPVPQREVMRQRRYADGKFADDCASLFDVTSEIAVLGWIDAIDAAPEHPDGSPFGIECAGMRRRVDSACETRHDDGAGGRQIARQLPRQAQRV